MKDYPVRLISASIKVNSEVDIKLSKLDECYFLEINKSSLQFKHEDLDAIVKLYNVLNSLEKKP